MNNRNLEEKLTPAAKEALKELTKSYRDQILLEANKNALRYTGEVEEISVRDIFASLDEINKRQTGEYGIGKKERIFRIFIFVGILYSIGGFGYLLYQNLQLKFGYQELIGFTFGILGILISVGSYLYLRAYKPRIYREKNMMQISTSEYEPSMIAVQKWLDLELSIRNKIASLYGESFANKPISAHMKELYHDNYLSENDYMELRDLLSIRNNLLHENKYLSESEIKKFINSTDRLLKKLD